MEMKIHFYLSLNSSVPSLIANSPVVSKEPQRMTLYHDRFSWLLKVVRFGWNELFFFLFFAERCDAA